MLTILHNVVQEKGHKGIRTITIADVLRFAVEDVAEDKLETFYTKNAFERRDLLKTLANKVVKRLGPIQVIVRSTVDPDEKAMLAAISPYSTSEYAARV